MAKRLFDLLFGSLMAVLTLPVVTLAALGVFLSDPGPVLYKAPRTGVNGQTFPLYKLRSMRRRRPRVSNPALFATRCAMQPKYTA